MRRPGIAIGTGIHGRIQRQQLGTVQQLGDMLQGITDGHARIDAE